MVTPFTKENTIDTAALSDQAAFQISEGTKALIVCGTTGEASTMTPIEQAQAIQAVSKAANQRVPVIAGVGGNDTAKVIASCHMARQAGADAVLAVTPYYNKTTQEGLIAHFRAVADSSELPVILYNVPSRTGLNMTAETAAQLAAHENIIGTKEASGDISQVINIIRLCEDRLPVYSGNDDNTLPILSVGGIGVISVAANIVPALINKLCEAFFMEDIKGAKDIQLTLMPLFGALFHEVSPSPVKAAMKILGMHVGDVRLPLVPIRQDTRELLIACMDQLAIQR